MICAEGHSFDIARQGYLSLTLPRRRPHRGDSAAMVAAREAFLAAGHFAPIADAIIAAAAQAEGFIVDVGAGTGYYLASLLDALPASSGLALDVSRPALRRAARAHPRITAAACDVWEQLPLRDDTADLLLNVFAPRNGAEMARVLARDGTLIVVTPTQRHLRQLPGLLSVDVRKEERLLAELSPGLAPADRNELEFDMSLSKAEALNAIAMGPSARHTPAVDLPERLTVTASVVVETYRSTSRR